MATTAYPRYIGVFVKLYSKKRSTNEGTGNASGNISSSQLFGRCLLVGNLRLLRRNVLGVPSNRTQSGRYNFFRSILYHYGFLFVWRRRCTSFPSEWCFSTLSWAGYLRSAYSNCLRLYAFTGVVYKVKHRGGYRRSYASYILRHSSYVGTSISILLMHYNFL